MLWIDGEGPRDIPGWAHLYLATTLKVAPESLYALRCVQKVSFEEGKPVTLIRIFDPRASEEALRIENFVSLDWHPELVLYEGYWEKESDRVYLECRSVREQ